MANYSALLQVLPLCGAVSISWLFQLSELQHQPGGKRDKSHNIAKWFPNVPPKRHMCSHRTILKFTDGKVFILTVTVLLTFWYADFTADSFRFNFCFPLKSFLLPYVASIVIKLGGNLTLRSLALAFNSGKVAEKESCV